MEERILHYVDIDTRRAMGFPPRKLPPSDLEIKQGIVCYNAGISFTQVEVGHWVWVSASRSGYIVWKHETRHYHHWRPYGVDSPINNEYIDFSVK